MPRPGATIGTGIGAAAMLLAAALWPVPAAALSVRVGPYHFYIPLHVRHHYHHHVRHPEHAASPVAPEAAAATPQDFAKVEFTFTLLDPRLAVAAAEASIFTSKPALQPFGYASILTTASAKAPQRPLCQNEADLAQAIVTPIRDATAADEQQAQLLQKLGEAAEDASASLDRSCAEPVPTHPADRLAFMARQVAAAKQALEMLRQPLQDFQQSLNDEQRARWAVLVAGDAEQNPSAANAACGNSATVVDRATEQIGHAVAIAGNQSDAFDELKAALERASGDLDRACGAPLPPTVSSRLDAMDSLLDAAQTAIKATTAAFTAFEAHLTAEQKRRFETTDLAGL